MELKIKSMRTKCKGIIFQIHYCPEIKIKKAIVFAYGLPGRPLNNGDIVVRNFIENNFIVVCPQYAGTYDSDGDFNLNNSIESINTAIDLIKAKKSDYPEDNFPEYEIDEVILCGGSFGASMVLMCASMRKDINKIISIALPLNWNKKEITEHLDYIEKLWKYTHRIKEENMNTFLQMDLRKTVNDLEDKKLFLIHGKNDKNVDPNNSIFIYDALAEKQASNILLLTEEEHAGCGILNDKNIFEKVIKWAK
ncbi:MAG: prolyl oligopeptidase family serine peptidase [Candidatus Aenigmarchaeota archaeon]|nr:prolyl oligopeptidase family serine peptidase [Candidatus Aenigmarchaeota archaeon]